MNLDVQTGFGSDLLLQSISGILIEKRFRIRAKHLDPTGTESATLIKISSVPPNLIDLGIRNEDASSSLDTRCSHGFYFQGSSRISRLNGKRCLVSHIFHVQHNLETRPKSRVSDPGGYNPDPTFENKNRKTGS